MSRLDHILAEDFYFATGWQEQAKQHGDGRGFARPVAAEQRSDRPRLNLHGNCVDGGYFFERLGQVLGSDRVGGHIISISRARLACASVCGKN